MHDQLGNGARLSRATTHERARHLGLREPVCDRPARPARPERGRCLRFREPVCNRPAQPDRAHRLRSRRPRG